MKLLYIAHYFPPCGGAGVQRTAKFVKYLPELGVDPVIVTGAMNLDDRWSPEDKSLLADIPESVRDYRVTTVPTNIFNKERIEALVEKGREAIRDTRPDLILVTLSPFSDSGVAARLSEEFDIPWVADLRDPWGLDEFQVYKSFFHRMSVRKKMQKALSTASGVIMNTPAAMELLLSSFPRFRNKKVTSITNGFDASDFVATVPKPRSSKFRIVHSGAFHTHMGLHQRDHPLIYRILGRATSGVRLLPRSPYYLLKALEEIQRSSSGRFDEIEVVFVGRLSKADEQVISQSSVASCVSSPGYVDHVRSAEYVRSADLLFLPLHERQDGKRASIVPGKAYEYLASGNPVLGALPAGDARDYLKAAGNVFLAEPSDVDALVEGINHHFEQWKEGAISYSRDSGALEAFERRTLTVKLAGFLNEVAKAGVVK